VAVEMDVGSEKIWYLLEKDCSQSELVDVDFHGFQVKTHLRHTIQPHGLDRMDLLLVYPEH
jgi:extradiol dioxygenase family protein